jgi:hypothetical protein
MRHPIAQQAYDAFRADVELQPAISLRAGNAIDQYEQPPPFDPALDAPTDAYLAAYAFNGLVFLDAASWRHYLPLLIDYTLRQLGAASMAPHGLLASLRPPDHEPPRLATLSPEQEAAIVAFLQALAFGDDTLAYQDDALLILEEWWLPNARYRTRPGQAGE